VSAQGKGGGANSAEPQRGEKQQKPATYRHRNRPRPIHKNTSKHRWCRNRARCTLGRCFPWGTRRRAPAGPCRPRPLWLSGSRPALFGQTRPAPVSRGPQRVRRPSFFARASGGAETAERHPSPPPPPARPSERCPPPQRRPRPRTTPEAPAPASTSQHALWLFVCWLRGGGGVFVSPPPLSRSLRCPTRTERRDFFQKKRRRNWCLTRLECFLSHLEDFAFSTPSQAKSRWWIHRRGKFFFFFFSLSSFLPLFLRSSLFLFLRVRLLSRCLAVLFLL
jgi:hypothetical protein